MSKSNVKQLVVAKYKEDISWIPQVDADSVIIYNKNPDDVIGISLPNIGREAHTYIYHIIANYNNLADVTIFSQGSPFNHFPNDNPIQLYNSISRDFKGFKPFSWTGGIEKQRYYGEMQPGECDRRELEGSHYFTRLIKGPKGIFEQSTGRRCPDTAIAQTNAQFAISKDVLLQYSLNTYLHLMSYFFYPEPETVPFEFEYMWCILFGKW